MSRASDLVDQIPYARLIGMRVEHDEEGMIGVLPVKDTNVGNPWLPAVHGGVIGAFLEMTALLALLDQGDADRIARPINFSTDFLKSARVEPTHGRAEIVKLGRRIANVRVVAYQADRTRPVAAGIGNFLL